MRYKLFPPGERGPFWYCRGSHQNRRFEFSTKEGNPADRGAAEKSAIAEINERLQNPLTSGGKDVTFGAAAVHFMATKDRSRTEQTFYRRLIGYMGHMRCTEIRDVHLQDACQKLYPQITNGSSKNRMVISIASAVLHYSARQDWCPFRKFTRFPQPKKSPRSAARPEDIKALLANTEGSRRLFIALLYETGMRHADVLSLTLANVDLEKGIIYRRVTKTDDKIGMPVSSELTRLLRLAKPVKGDRLFPWADSNSAGKWLRRLTRRLGIKYTAHMSRHALATDLLERKIPDRLAMAYGAWRDVRSLHWYQHAAPTLLPGRSFALLGGKPGEGAKKRRKTA